MAVPGTRPDFAHASLPRVYQAMLGLPGTFPADRVMAGSVEAAWGPPAPGHLPAPREMALRNRQFLTRAVAYAAGLGAGQVLDLGAGIPVCGREVRLPDGTRVTLRDTHEAAREANPSARTVYVDSDPFVASHAAALLRDVPGTAVIAADLADPGAVLAAVTGPGGIDLSQPACVVLGMVVHLMAAEKAREVISAYVAAVAPGSFLVISCARCDPPPGDPGLAERIAAAYGGAVFNHSRGEFASFFGGARLVPPGVVMARAWRPERPAPLDPCSPGWVLAGVGVKGRRSRALPESVVTQPSRVEFFPWREARFRAERRSRGTERVCSQGRGHDLRVSGFRRNARLNACSVQGTCVQSAVCSSTPLTCAFTSDLTAPIPVPVALVLHPSPVGARTARRALV